MNLVTKLHKFISPSDYKPLTPYKLMLPIAKNYMLLNIWDTKIVDGIWKIQINGEDINEKEYKTRSLHAGDKLKIELSFHESYTKITHEYVIQPDD